MNRAVFLDRDGVINEISEGEFVNDMSELKLVEGAIEGIKLINSLGLKVIVVTNTPQVARGLCTEVEIEKMHEDLKNLLEKEGATIDTFYYCPHHPEKHHTDIKPELMKYRTECKCRKPNIGMIEEAAQVFGLEIKNSFLIGDRTVDIKTGQNCGARTILVKTGMAGDDKKFDTEADFVVNNILDAAKLIEKIINIKTLILVGGRGERLKPLTNDIPKPMLLISGSPLLEHLVLLNKKFGIKNIVMSGNYLFDNIKNYFGNGSKFGLHIEYVDDGDNYLGSGGALRNSAKLLTENFIVISGDILTNINLWEVVKFHLKKNGIATLVVRETDHPHDSDLIVMDKNSRAVKFYGKNITNKPGNIANTSIFVFKKVIINHIQGVSPNLENDVISNIVKSSEVYCYLNTKYFIKDIGTFERYESVKNLKLNTFS